ncbi:MAG: NAD(P)H-dependent oxidoreductase [Actinomycetota bacterium]
MTVAVVIGNPNPGGRTTTIGTTVGEAIAAARSDSVTVRELADVAPHLFEWGNEAVDALTAEVAAADVIVFACPTYKATYTGLLKSFLDKYGPDGLAGTKSVPVMVGSALQHALAPEVHLRPLLVELGSSVPTRGLYVLDSELDQLDAAVATWAESAVGLLT